MPSMHVHKLWVSKSRVMDHNYSVVMQSHQNKTLQNRCLTYAVETTSSPNRKPVGRKIGGEEESATLFNS